MRKTHPPPQTPPPPNLSTPHHLSSLALSPPFKHTYIHTYIHALPPIPSRTSPIRRSRTQNPSVVNNSREFFLQGIRGEGGGGVIISLHQSYRSSVCPPRTTSPKDTRDVRRRSGDEALSPPPLPPPSTPAAHRARGLAGVNYFLPS